MKPSIDSIKERFSNVDEKFIREHFSRLGDRYFERFSEDEIAEHIEILSTITPQTPVKVRVHSLGKSGVECSVFAYDYPYEFSLITGVMAGMGFHIVTGDIFTYEHQKPDSDVSIRKKSVLSKTRDMSSGRRKIIDHFMGWVDSPFSFDAWSRKLKKQLEAIIRLLERGDRDSLEKAKHDVNEMVIRRLERTPISSGSFLSPMNISVDNETSQYTRLVVVSEDTPAFLYALSNALSRQGISIKHVKIRTVNRRVEDEIDIVDSRERKIDSPEMLDRIKLSVLVTKQFTYFLGSAPDPYTALTRFEFLVTELLRTPSTGKWLELLSNPYTLQNLAKLLGTSDFLWEDFIRVQYEALLPMLKPHLTKNRFSAPIGTLPRRLRMELEKGNSFEEKKRILNKFKDREIFLIDLDHILNPEVNFEVLAKRLTCLAENVVREASRLVYKRLVQRFGRPRTIGGLEAKYAIFGLGKLGGADLGYASDIELLFVYSDKGKTDGSEPIENTEFFEILARDTARMIEAKREGIFQVDLRLRPHGNAGPLACSLNRFCQYYGPEGQAHAYERLALVRLRALAGGRELGARVERIRDEIVYMNDSICFEELRELRERQFREKVSSGKLNAKFSPGGLVDIEYDVQLLQVMYGKENVALRTPKIREALKALSEAGVLAPNESEQLLRAYNFLRMLINGMRMLRGSAVDLFLPDFDSDEFEHLARRMGYKIEGGLGPAQRLKIDVETNMALVRAFVERHFGRDSLPGPKMGSVADIVLSESVPRELYDRILSLYGFKNTFRAYRNLRSLASHDATGRSFIRLVTLAADILARTPDPDMALNNWERFIHSLPSPEFHYRLYLSQPMRLEILLSILAGSQFLADTLIRNPGFLDWLTAPENLHRFRKKDDLIRELGMSLESSPSHRIWLNRLRRLKRREILRIGTRDMYLNVATQTVTEELSVLADAIVDVALRGVTKRLTKTKSGEFEELANKFCVLALGKLGGGELNYSSDIDLVAVCDSGHSEDTLPFKLSEIMESLRSDLSKHTEQGYAYRVDLRLRPYGESGELVSTLPAMLKYYRNSASLWEVQAALKMRPVAGNVYLGFQLVEELRKVIFKKRDPWDIVRSIEKMRKAGADRCAGVRFKKIDVKSGEGGIRDIEFLVQGLQLIHGAEDGDLFEGNTVKALRLLEARSILPAGIVDSLVADYYFLRRIEHYLQIMEDRQIHVLPCDKHQLTVLAKRVSGFESNASKFMDAVDACLRRVRKTYLSYLVEKYG